MRVNVEKSDPDVDEQRHISIIAKKGVADAVETNVLAWNDKPFNFNGPEYEYFIRDPYFKVEYFSGTLRVYINEIL